MQVRQFFFFTLGLFFLFQAENAFSQKVTINENGEKIVVYPDGSWHFYKEGAADSTIVEQPMPEPVLEKPKKEKKKKRKSKGKKKKGTKTKKTKKNQKDKEGKAKHDKAALELTEKLKAVERAERAAAIEEAARLVEEEAVFKRIFLEEELEEAYHSLEMTHEDIIAIELRLKKAKDEEKIAVSNYKKAKDRSKVYERMIDMSIGKRRKALAKLDSDLSLPAEQVGLTDAIATSGISEAQEVYESEVLMDRPSIRTYDPKSNVLRYPPAHPCKLAYDQVDEFSGKKRKQTQQTHFFSHTPDRFRSYFKGREYLVCKGTLIAMNGTPRSFNLEFTIATDQAAREFGILEKGSQLILRFIDGERLILLNNKTATGVIDPVTKTTTYSTSYSLSKGQIKTLKGAEVDKVRMIWATGYEDYEVYKVDFFRDLFRCLEEG